MKKITIGMDLGTLNILQNCKFIKPKNKQAIKAFFSIIKTIDVLKFLDGKLYIFSLYCIKKKKIIKIHKYLKLILLKEQNSSNLKLKEDQTENSNIKKSTKARIKLLQDRFKFINFFKINVLLSLFFLLF